MSTMTTNLERFVARHHMLIDKAEERFAERQTKDPGVRVEDVVAEFVEGCRRAIARRDTIAGVYAAMAAHLAMNAAGIAQICLKSDHGVPTVASMSAS